MFTKLLPTLGAALLAFASLTAAATPRAAAQPVSIAVQCSVAALKAAIATANSSNGGTLDLAAGCVYTLTTVDNTTTNGPNGLPVITSPVTIAGNGATVVRSTQTGTPDFRFFELAAPATLTARDLTLRGGLVKGGSEGAIYQATGTSLSITRATFDGNDTPNTNSPFHIGLGGAIFTKGTATVDSSRFTNNGDVTQDGGAVENFGGQVTLTNCTFRANEASTGGALHSGGANGVTHVVGGVFESNRGGDAGGAIDNDGLNAMHVSGTSFRDNFVTGSGADIFNGGQLTVTGARFATGSATQGGAIFNGGIATVSSSDVTAAFGINGGAIRNKGRLDLGTSSLAGNRSYAGGGIYNDAGALATLDHVAIRSNAAVLQPGDGQGDGGGIYNAGNMTMVATQVAGNRAAHDGGGVFNAGSVSIQGGTAVVANTPNDCVNRSGGAGC